MNYDRESGRCFDCDQRTNCICAPEEEMFDEDNEYYGRDGYEECREQYESIMICDHCSEPTDVCSCPWCRWCGAGIEENVKLNKIKCPVNRCDGIGDDVCVACKNKHDKDHGL